jgi:hypothetical protein
MLVRANRTGKVLAGSCKLPKRDDIRYINPIFEEEYRPGAFINDGEIVEAVCKGGTAMNVSANFDRSNLCVNTRWDRPWSFYPECQGKLIIFANTWYNIFGSQFFVTII